MKGQLLLQLKEAIDGVSKEVGLDDPGDPFQLYDSMTCNLLPFLYSQQVPCEVKNHIHAPPPNETQMRSTVMQERSQISKAKLLMWVEIDSSILVTEKFPGRSFTSKCNLWTEESALCSPSCSQTVDKGATKRKELLR
ncbi:uncharacterized protein LOC143835292 [Paroedura picta]|uniref:uncharacterized protein LOC143835292 n=1 Tax=Paroedura picta TaxID=143630 RepID=UPI00405773ED